MLILHIIQPDPFNLVATLPSRIRDNHHQLQTLFAEALAVALPVN